uniref:uncharacterized protein LOC120335084 n=1 Tax=Styela clava TaxID=7725 RepID=UPI00193A8B74|nr:uncharacterized protein LOC120335084 [Styela clava]
MNLPALTILFFAITHISSGQEPWKSECVDGFKLLFFKEKKNYTEAKSACESAGSYLAKVDNQKITDVINPVLKIDQFNDKFFIGGNAIAKEDDWKWQDGTDVIMRGEKGYQNWLAVKKFIDFSTSMTNKRVTNLLANYWQPHCNYVQKSFIELISFKTEFQGPYLEIQSTGQNQMTCAKTRCNPGTNVEWYYASSVIPTDPSKRVYQTKQSGSAILHLQNADISYAGNYSCWSWVKNGENKINYEVDGTPTINHIQKYACNSDLLISWEPHKNAVGFPHRISVLGPLLKGERKWVSPLKPLTQSTLISNLDSDTTYKIWIEACLSKDACTELESDTYARSIIKTGGKALSAKSAFFKQIEENETCIISWDIDNEESIELYTVELVLNSTLVTSRSSQIQKVDSNVSNMTSASEYHFQPKPNREYSASVMIFSCAGSSKSLRVRGSCSGTSKAPTMVHPPKIVGDSGISKSGEINITIQMPYESNGLISCIFVLVDKDCFETSTEFTMDDLITFNSTADGKKYIAMANQVANIKEKTVNVTLGDESVTQCDIAGFEATDVAMGTDFLFIGTNRKLNKENFPSISIVSATPSEKEIYFKKSLRITLGKEKKSFTFNFPSFVIGFIIPLLFLGITGWIIRKLKLKIEEMEQNEAIKIHNYETISDQATTSTHQTAGTTYENVLEEMAGYEHPLPSTSVQANKKPSTKITGLD